MKREFIEIFLAVWGTGIIKLLALLLAGGIAAAIYHIVS